MGRDPKSLSRRGFLWSNASIQVFRLVRTFKTHIHACLYKDLLLIRSYYPTTTCVLRYVALWLYTTAPCVYAFMSYRARLAYTRVTSAAGEELEREWTTTKCVNRYEIILHRTWARIVYTCVWMNEWMNEWDTQIPVNTIEAESTAAVSSVHSSLMGFIWFTRVGGWESGQSGLLAINRLTVGIGSLLLRRSTGFSTNQRGRSGPDR